MPQSIPAGLTRTHVLQALADLDAGVDHPFGQPTGYELLHEGKRYPPKAAVGLACRYFLGGQPIEPWVNRFTFPRTGRRQGRAAPGFTEGDLNRP